MANRRIMQDYNALLKTNTAALGFDVEMDMSNIYVWTARLQGFDGDLASDMRRLDIRHITLEIKFPTDYPFSPPFIRVVSPRFRFHTGHVTIGGSICAEYLCTSGWSPAQDIEALLVQIRTDIQAGGGRIERGGMYSEREAREAFRRVAREHGWNT